MRILYLTLKKKWFDMIASGEKKVEYRKIKPYWESRLMPLRQVKIFDEIHFKNGYSEDSPFMSVAWEGLRLEEFEGEMCFAIKLGKILEIRK